MTATDIRPAAVTRRVPVARAYRFELVKLVSQWRIRLLVLACWVAPALFVAGVSQQSTLPSDTLFGRWMLATGWAGPLVVLGFAGTWALPVLTSVVAGDVFAAEDRHGTWRHLLVAVRSPRRIFAAKALASLTVILMLVAGLVGSSMVGGLLAVGNRQLVGLDGHLLAPGTPPAGCCSRGSARSPRPWPSPRSDSSDRSRWDGPRWGCCCPRWSRSRCRSPRCCRCRWPSASPCPAMPSSPGTACSPVPPSSPRSSPASRSAWRGPPSPPHWPVSCSYGGTSPIRPTTGPGAARSPSACCRSPR